MLRRFLQFALFGSALGLLATGCQTTLGPTGLGIDVLPDDARVTVVSDVDGTVVHDGYGDVMLSGLAPGPYVVFMGDGSDMVVEFVTLRVRATVRTRATVETMARDDKGPGGHTETAGNNLSFPVIWAEDGASMPVGGDFGRPKLTVPFDVTGDGSITVDDQILGYYQFAQKVEGNAWQAESAVALDAPVFVTDVDWGDSLESVDMKLGRPVRVELTLYKELATTYDGEAELPTTMDAFVMTMLANPSSPDEVQGAGATASKVDLTVDPPVGTLSDVHLVESGEATVYSHVGGLVIQPLVGTRDVIADGDLGWNGAMWIDADDTDDVGIDAPLGGITFSSELNVGGKVIFGLSQGGWRPREVGDYRITFFVDPDANTQLDHAAIREAIEEAALAPLAEEGEAGGTGVVLTGLDPVTSIDRNLTYIDVRVVAGGGGGGGKPK